jgi:PKD repeat protein
MVLVPEIPVADFISDIVSGRVPLTVRFTDTSLNTPTSWLWDLNGDGRIDSQTRNPQYTYKEPGIYMVTLTVVSSAGKDTETKKGYITVEKGLQGPVADFSAKPVRGTAPLTIFFSDLSRNNPLSFAWDFTNDGLIDSREQNPHFTYTDPGTYSVQLTVRSETGTDTELKTDYILVDGPVSVTDTARVPTTPVPMVTVPGPTAPLPPSPIPPTALPAPLPGEDSPDYTLLLAILIAVLLFIGAYALVRSRSSKSRSEEPQDLKVVVSGGIDYGDGLSSLMDGSESRLKKEIREAEREEERDEHGS